MAAHSPAIAGFDIANVEQLTFYALPDLQSGSSIGGFLIRIYPKQNFWTSSAAFQDCKCAMAAHSPAIAKFDIANVEQLTFYALPDLQSESFIGGFGIRVLLCCKNFHYA